MASEVSPANFRFNAWRRALGNFALLKHRQCQGQLVSMHQSGTHWLKFMLANALSYQYGVPAPTFNHANDLIGGPRDAIRYPHLPRLISSHSIAHPLLHHDVAHGLLKLPHYVVLVRDIRAVLVANYAKWSERYDVPFTDYLAGDMRGRRFNSDIWWAFRFLNSWGRILERCPSRVSLLRYEDLLSDTGLELSRINSALDLGLSDGALAHGIKVSSKAAMAQKDDPARPPGAVRETMSKPLDDYDSAARAQLSALCARHLRYPLGYDYTRW